MTSLFDPTYLKALLLWVSLVSGYPIPEGTEPPPIAMEFPKPMDTGCDGEWAAYTDLNNGNIYLNKELWPTFDSVDRECTIAHEFVHFLQFKTKNIGGLLEPPAYEVTAQCYEKYRDKQRAKWARSELKRHQISCKR